MPGKPPEREETLRNLIIKLCYAAERPFPPSYWIVDGVSEEITLGGRRACALFVSSQLIPFEYDFVNHKRFCKYSHAGISGLDGQGGLLKDLAECGWYEVEDIKPEPGDILLWDVSPFLEEGEEPTEHMGFFLGGELAISTDQRKQGAPVFHHWQCHTDSVTPRSVKKILRHPFLYKQVPSL